MTPSMKFAAELAGARMSAKNCPVPKNSVSKKAKKRPFSKGGSKKRIVD